MKEIVAQNLFCGISEPDINLVSEILDSKGSEGFINTINWTDFPVKPEVRFKIGYGEKEIFLKYYVHESSIKAEMTSPNQNIWEDSCVEFFVSPAGDGQYYNFEFNPIGTTLMAVGSSRDGRVFAGKDIISEIRKLASMEIKPFPEKTGDFFWTLTLAIPVQIFFNHKIKDLKDKIFHANFYKCGDKLSTPHFLSWNPIETEKPDFHRPEYFGKIRFA
jgi:hypothetical protein